jgi:CO dehydrogenase maturation factor
MKIALAGKGGVGKTTISASLARYLADGGERVFAIDADPNANLALSLGMSREQGGQVVPISEMRELIAERTGVEPGSVGAYFKVNPRVDDLPDRFKLEHQGVMFLQVGAIKEPSAGCYCPENALLKSLLMNLVLLRDETVVLDMEAGFEHLTRGTSQAFDAMIIVVEPSLQSVVTATRIDALAQKIGIRNVFYVGNMVRDAEDRAFIANELEGSTVVGYVSYSDDIRTAVREGRSPYDVSPRLVAEIAAIWDGVLRQVGDGPEA